MALPEFYILRTYRPHKKPEEQEYTPYEEAYEHDDEIDDLFNSGIKDDPGSRNFVDGQVETAIEAHIEALREAARRRRIGVIAHQTAFHPQQIYLPNSNALFIADTEDDRRVQDALWTSLDANRRLAGLLLQWHAPDAEVQREIESFNGELKRVYHWDLRDGINMPLIISRCLDFVRAKKAKLNPPSRPT